MLNSPSDKTTRRQPFYQELVATKDLTMEQAQAAVMANKLGERRADLENSLYPGPAR